MESSQHRAGQPESAGLLLLNQVPPRGDRLSRAAGTGDGEGREWASVVSQPVKLTFPHLGIAVISAEVIVTWRVYLLESYFKGSIKVLRSSEDTTSPSS